MIIERLGSAIPEDDAKSPQETDERDFADSTAFDSVENIVSDNETVHATFRSPEGLARIDDGGRRRVPHALVAAVTDRRLLFVPETRSEGATGTIAYRDLAAADLEDGALEMATVDGARWRLPVPESARPVAAVSHLRWVGELRGRLVSCRNDVELAAGEIRDYADSRDWERALETYREARDPLDSLICAVELTEPVAEAAVAPGLTDLEQSLETAHARLYIERATSQLELGRQLVGNEDYDQARKVLGNARTHYQRAQDVAEEVLRGDAFQFGTQRGLADDLTRLGWELETVAAEPVRQAHEAKIRAREADDPERAIDHWETAFRRYGNVLTLGDGGLDFAGDPEDVRDRMALAADRLVALRRETAREQWNEGRRRQRAGETKPALRHCIAAREHMERAHELAAEFAPDEAGTVATHLAQMTDVLAGVRETAAVDGSPEAPAGESAPDPGDGADRGGERDGDAEPDAGPGGDDQPLSVEDLAELDTHQELAFELDDGFAADATAEATAEATDDADRSETPGNGRVRPE